MTTLLTGAAVYFTGPCAYCGNAAADHEQHARYWTCPPVGTTSSRFWRRAWKALAHQLLHRLCVQNEIIHQQTLVIARLEAERELLRNDVSALRTTLTALHDTIGRFP